MRINVLQHTPNEGPGAIALWAQQHQHQLYILSSVSISQIARTN